MAVQQGTYVPFSLYPPQYLLFVFLFFVRLFRAAPVAYGVSQARGPIGAAAASLRQSHSNSGSKPCLQPTPQLMATWDL